jgi:plasmid maintenance system antidote protein VapI
MKKRKTLREHLRENEITQADLATAMDITHWAVIKKLNGQRRWSVDEVIRLAGYLAKRKAPVTIDSLVTMCSTED